MLLLEWDGDADGHGTVFLNVEVGDGLRGVVVLFAGELAEQLANLVTEDVADTLALVEDAVGRGLLERFQITVSCFERGFVDVHLLLDLHLLSAEYLHFGFVFCTALSLDSFNFNLGHNLTNLVVFY